MGSEMCIRDRLDPAQVVVVTVRLAAVDMDSGRDREARHGNPDAVSYTHLTLPTISPAESDGSLGLLNPAQVELVAVGLSVIDTNTRRD